MTNTKRNHVAPATWQTIGPATQPSANIFISILIVGAAFGLALALCLS